MGHRGGHGGRPQKNLAQLHFRMARTEETSISCGLVAPLREATTHSSAVDICPFPRDLLQVGSDAEWSCSRTMVLQSWAALPPMPPCHHHAAADFDEPVRISHISKTVLSIVKFGGPGGIRTPGLLNAIEARSQLRYRPTLGDEPEAMPPTQRSRIAPSSPRQQGKGVLPQACRQPPLGTTRAGRLCGGGSAGRRMRSALHREEFHGAQRSQSCNGPRRQRQGGRPHRRYRGQQAQPAPWRRDGARMDDGLDACRADGRGESRCPQRGASAVIPRDDLPRHRVRGRATSATCT